MGPRRRAGELPARGMLLIEGPSARRDDKLGRVQLRGEIADAWGEEGTVCRAVWDDSAARRAFL